MSAAVLKFSATKLVLCRRDEAYKVLKKLRSAIMGINEKATYQNLGELCKMEQEQGKERQRKKATTKTEKWREDNAYIYLTKLY